MGRLPTPGSDDGTWGTLLNDFLKVAHNPDGTINSSALTIAGVEEVASKGEANGYAALDSTAKVPTAQLRAVSQIITFAEAGILVAQPGLTRFRFPFAATITGVTAAIDTAPTGQAVIVDINKNGSTIFTTQANRPSIATGNNATSAVATPNTTGVVAGRLLNSRYRSNRQ